MVLFIVIHRIQFFDYVRLRNEGSFISNVIIVVVIALIAGLVVDDDRRRRTFATRAYSIGKKVSFVYMELVLP